MARAIEESLEDSANLPSPDVLAQEIPPSRHERKEFEGFSVKNRSFDPCHEKSSAAEAFI